MTEAAALPEDVPHEDYMSFVGVSTGSSSINRVFPAWADLLGLPTRRLVGLDLPLDATPEQYRSTLEAIRDDRNNRGALVTTHKLNLYRAASDLFDEIDEFARLCGEVSSVSKRDDRLVGHAKDPITAGLAVEELLPADAFENRAEVLCLGAGGAGIALTYYLARRHVRPARITCADTDEDRLAHIRDVHLAAGLPDVFRYVHVASAADNDRLAADLPEASLVVNATGLGKDRPGSPLTDAVRFPDGAIAWDFNYRGQLTFLDQAAAQRHRGVQAVDGWRYFIHGWTQVVAEVFDIKLTSALVESLADAAAVVR
jgi:shikimate 5-dehydrogenase